MAGTELMTIAEMAERYSFSKTTIREAIHANELAAFKPQLKGRPGNGHWRIRKADADAWVNAMIAEWERAERNSLSA